MRVNPKRIIRVLNKSGQQVKDAADKLGIHQTTIYRWIKRVNGKRYLNKSTVLVMEPGLKRLSTRPYNINYALNDSEKGKIAALRRKYGITAEKITVQLKLDVHHRTTHRFLKRIGLVREYSYHRRPRFQDTFHMHAKNTKSIGYLQMDVKYITPELSGLPWTCFEYAIIDIYSRYKEAVILNHLDQDGAMAALLEILPRLPFKPLFIQTDNGLEFQSRFDKLCSDLKLEHYYIHKNNPNENGIIERSFRTDEEEFFFRLEKRPEHYDELRSLFAEFLKYYNYERLHLGINLKTPYQVVAYVVSD